MLRLSLSALGLMALLGLSDALYAQGTSPERSTPPTCTPALLPRAEKAAIEREYSERTRVEGQTKADAWLRNKARTLLNRLEDEGVCTISSRGSKQTARPSAPTTTKAPRGKDGKPCKRTRMVNRNVANVGGGPMMMVLVPVCAD